MEEGAIKMSLSGDRIRACRIKMHMTQEEVANYLGIKKQAVYKYESGAVTNIPLENVEALAQLFSVTPAYIAGWDEKDPAPPPDQPQNDELRLLLRGLNKLTPDQVEQAKDMFRIMFMKTNPDLFDKGEENK